MPAVKHATGFPWTPKHACVHTCHAHIHDRYEHVNTYMIDTNISTHTCEI